MKSLNKRSVSIRNKRIYLAYFALILLFTGLSSATVIAQDHYSNKSGAAAYTTDIQGINTNLTEVPVKGTATFITSDDQLYITIIASGLSPSMMHLQHIHGFVDTNDEATCPAPGADTNGDGIIDLIETHESTGVTLIPFNAAPVDLQIKTDSYPVANGEGVLTYRMKVLLDDLNEAIQEEYNIENLSLENRVIYLHGVPENTDLPESVESLPGVPAQVTVPVACGEIEAL